MKIKLAELRALVVLVISYIVIVGAILFAVRLGVALTFYIKNGYFYFAWVDVLSYAMTVGLSAGIPLGIGIWFMSWMKTRKNT
ncbi:MULTISPECIES: hypothetical protein [Serratia]|uniref:hypothetical protein n=1 Tax=Serratia TaxID=613 RepID=UPI00135B0768|nr:MULTISPECIES: hypothetical protein [Serratia]